MSLYSSIYRHCFWPTYEILRGRQTYKLLRQSEKRQWLSPTEFQEFQSIELTKLFQQAYSHSALHRSRFDQVGLKPTAIHALDDLRRLPLLTRDDMREHREELLADNYHGRVYVHRTGGSTGAPLAFYMTRDSYEWRNAMTLRGYGWAGAHDGEKVLYLWALAATPQDRWHRLKTGLHDTVLRRHIFNSFPLTAAILGQCRDALNQFQPRVVVGYTSVLEQFARYIRKHGGLRVRPQSVITGAEGVNDAQRELLREVFDAPVFASYGSREFKLIAMECERGGLHVSADNLLVEVIHNNRPAQTGELGKIVVTDLHNYGMPFIRYEIGDLATPGATACPCGRGLPLLGPVHGRVADLIRTPDGRFVSGLLFPHLLKEFDWIEQYQVIQKELDRVQLKIVAPDVAAAERGLPQLRQQILAVLGTGVRLETELVREIPRTATGKHRAVLSEIPVQI